MIKKRLFNPIFLMIQKRYVFVFISILFAFCFLHKSYAITQSEVYKIPKLQGEISLWYQQCNKKNYNACYFLGLAYYDGYKVLPNKTKSQGFLEMACKQDIVDSCLALAFIAAAQKKDTQSLVSLYEKTCNLGHKASCQKLIDLLTPTITRDSEEKEKQKVYELLQRICLLNEENTCEQADTFELHFMSSTTKYAEMEFSKIVKLCEIAQEKKEKQQGNFDLSACGIVGEMYANENGVEKDKSQAKYYFSLACSNHNKFCYQEVLDTILNP